MIRIFPLAGTAVLTMFASLVALPPDACGIDVRQTGSNALLNQIRLTVTVKRGCALDRRAVIRFRTVQGGVIPVNGVILRSSYPNHISFWLTRGDGIRPGPSVEQKLSGTFKTVWRFGQ